jgi:ubiquinone biosynthesis monooxygenase Coq7
MQITQALRICSSAVRRTHVCRPHGYCTRTACFQFDPVSISKEIASEHELERIAPDPLEIDFTTRLPYSDPSAEWTWLDRELSSNVAGETGAVYIYVGADAALRWRQKLLFGGAESTKEFVRNHCAAEQLHLDLFVALIPHHKHTRLLPIWKAAGFALGFLPALVSDRALFLTVEAVETFVEVHYMEQIEVLSEHGRCPHLVSLLKHCCADEVHHKEDAAARRVVGGDSAGWLTTTVEKVIARVWTGIVRLGSTVAAETARRV